MLLIRRMEETILELRRADRVAGSIHLSVGQESAPVGVGAQLDERDRVVATYRGHGWALVRGVPLGSIFAEVLGRKGGTNGGRAGSAYLTAPEYGFVGENSIVGAGLPIADGVAMAQQFRGAGGVVVVSFGDGATNQGGSHEALVFAAARRLPVLFVCENNSWSEMTPITDTVPGTELHRRAAGYGLRAGLVDGTVVGDVEAAAGAAIERLRAGGGPEFLEIRVPRILGHYNGDLQLYRSDADKQEHLDRDPLAHEIAASGVSADEVEAVRGEVEAEVQEALAWAEASPLADVTTAADHVVDAAVASAVAPLPTEGKELAYGLAVNRALGVELEERPEVVLFGEDIAIPGGTFGVTRNLRKNFGERVFDTPISETAILGAAVGASIQGLRPVVEIMWSDFMLVAFDQLVNQAANVRYISEGRVTAPLVVRTQQGVTPGSCAQHSQSLEALLAHIPGLRIGMPSTSADAYAMTRAAVAADDPVILIESRAMYLDKGIVDLDAPVEAIGGARTRRSGSDVLIVSWGRMCDIALSAADELADRGVDATVLDLRWLSPLDDAAIARAVADNGGRVVVAHEANLTGGFGAEIAARIASEHFAHLTAPIERVGLPDVRVPSAPALQSALLPTSAHVRDAALRLTDARHAYVA